MDAGADSQLDPPSRLDGGDDRPTDAGVDADIDAGEQDAGPLDDQERLLAAVRHCSRSKQCNGGISCANEDGSSICVEFAETTLYPGPCAIRERGYPDNYQEGRDQYSVNSCHYGYEGDRLQRVDHAGFDDGGDGIWGGGYYEYGASGEVTRYDYWETEFVSADCNAGSFIHGGGRVVHEPPADVMDWCPGWADAREARNYPRGTAAIYAEASFALHVLYECSSVPWWRPVGMLVGFGADTCVRTRLAPGHAIDSCGTQGGQSATWTREIVHDDAGRTLSQLDVDYDGVGAVIRSWQTAFTYDGAGRLKTVQVHVDDWDLGVYTYYYDQAGNLVYSTHADAYDYGAIYDYDCWR